MGQWKIEREDEDNKWTWGKNKLSKCRRRMTPE